MNNETHHFPQIIGENSRAIEVYSPGELAMIEVNRRRSQRENLLETIFTLGRANKEIHIKNFEVFKELEDSDRLSLSDNQSEIILTYLQGEISQLDYRSALSRLIKAFNYLDSSSTSQQPLPTKKFMHFAGDGSSKSIIDYNPKLHTPDNRFPFIGIRFVTDGGRVLGISKENVLGIYVNEYGVLSGETYNLYDRDHFRVLNRLKADNAKLKDSAQEINAADIQVLQTALIYASESEKKNYETS